MASHLVDLVLVAEEDQGLYNKKVKNMIEDKRKRLLVNVNDLRRKNQARAAGLLKNAFEELMAFQLALKEYVTSVEPSYVTPTDEFFIAFEGSFGNKHVTPRTLTSRFLGNLVCCEGIVTKCEYCLSYLTELSKNRKKPTKSCSGD
ncbi:MCM DNA helicase complex subunit [Homalodisca vitripennis]|nr:MCM DNA helicase complex subunit [Homalodisca vitripennis]